MDRGLRGRFYSPVDWFFCIGKRTGYGLSFQWPAHRDGGPYFSERNGYRKAWHVLGACIKPLGPRWERRHRTPNPPAAVLRSGVTE